MVLEAPKPHFPEATCCNVEVVKGAAGFFLYSFDVMSEIKYSFELILFIASSTDSLLRNENLSILLIL